jgi:hypothetical protein
MALTPRSGRFAILVRRRLTEFNPWRTRCYRARSTTYPPGLQWYWKADFVDGLSDQAIALHVEDGSRLPTMHSAMNLHPMNGAAHRVGRKDTAFSYREATWPVEATIRCPEGDYSLTQVSTPRTDIRCPEGAIASPKFQPLEATIRCPKGL